MFIITTYRCVISFKIGPAYTKMMETQNSQKRVFRKISERVGLNSQLDGLQSIRLHGNYTLPKALKSVCKLSLQLKEKRMLVEKRKPLVSSSFARFLLSA